MINPSYFMATVSCVVIFVPCPDDYKLVSVNETRIKLPKLLLSKKPKILLKPTVITKH